MLWMLYGLRAGLGERWGSPKCEHFSPGSGRRSRPTSSASIRVNRWSRFPPSELLNTESLNTVRRGGLTFLQPSVPPVPP